MGVRSHGNDFPAELLIAAQHVVTGVWLRKSGLVAAGVDFDAFALFYQQLQNRVHLIGMLFVRKNAIPIRYIADDIIDRPLYIKIIKSPDILKGHIQVPVYAGSSVIGGPEIRIVRVKPIHQVGGADQKIEGLV